MALRSSDGLGEPHRNQTPRRSVTPVTEGYVHGIALAGEMAGRARRRHPVSVNFYTTVEVLAPAPPVDEEGKGRAY